MNDTIKAPATQPADSKPARVLDATQLQPKGKPRAKYVASRLNPRKMVANALIATGNQTRTAEILGINRRTVADILTRDPSALAEGKKTLAGKFAAASELGLEKAVGMVDMVKSPLEAMTFAGIAADKVAKLTEEKGPLVALQVNALADLMGEIRGLE